jgi:hypothetical protein
LKKNGLQIIFQNENHSRKAFFLESIIKSTIQLVEYRHEKHTGPKTGRKMKALVGNKFISLIFVC